MLPTSQPTSSFLNTQLYTDLGTSTSRLQYACYRDRGGRLQRGPTIRITPTTAPAGTP
jgi:hypothetical protein